MNYPRISFIILLFTIIITFIFKFSIVSPEVTEVPPQYFELKFNNVSSGCGNKVVLEEKSSFTHNNRKREYLISVPGNYDINKPANLVYAFHGRSTSNKIVRDYYDLEKHSGYPTIFVYPESLKRPDGTNTWNEKGKNQPDYDFFELLNNKITGEYCINMEGIFVVGHSLGASYVNSLACRKANILRGLGSLGGGGRINECSGSIAAIILHNPKDRLVPFENGKRVKNSYLENNDLEEITRELNSGKFNCVEYGDEISQNPVIWCPHNHDYSSDGTYYPHTWPDETGELIMNFFNNLM